MEIVNIIKRIKSKLPAVDVRDILFKLLLSWVLISAFYVASSDISFVNTFFFEKIKLSVFIVSVLTLWVILCKIKDKSFIRILMILGLLVYSILGAVGYTDFSFSVGCCIVIGIVVFLTDLSEIRLKIHWSVPWIMAGALIVGFTFFVGVICCLYYQNHWTSCFDFGIFSQMFYYMKESGLPLVTCERDRLLSHFAVHFSPIYYADPRSSHSACNAGADCCKRSYSAAAYLQSSQAFRHCLLCVCCHLYPLPVLCRRLFYIYPRE